MAQPSGKTVVFDLDGTLADTSRDLIAAANACFDSLGQGALLDPVADAATAFHGGRAMLRLGFARAEGVEGSAIEALVETQYQPLLDHYGQHIDVHTVMYEGAVDAIQQLKAAGYRVAVCTNKPSGLAEELLKRLGVRDMFGAMVGADTLPVRKPDPAPYLAAVEGAGGAVKQSFLLGDTVTDRKTAAAAGVPCALVTFGPDGEAVRALSPEALLPHYRDLMRVTQELIG
ncbi:Phosphoglycolate phosphatase [Aquimixticola soesokkakensis]|uniref:phosphoglycolate phosphatase n=1 Tax=Aquimixticola soesokkakensis TaxID=1519096 RepID=A0A1Y5S6I3_9RHOB|nr:HAD-IA family hydrolase [Aquimixticola soesokkakensis]SLN30891.1 Phosphoglycolate phosphatase [Aquimixticola soesokkakensis]